MKNIYVVWQFVPEDIRIYCLTDLTTEEFSDICGYHGHYINRVDTPMDIQAELRVFNEYLEQHDSFLVYPGKNPIDLKNGTIVVCGWIL